VQSVQSGLCRLKTSASDLRKKKKKNKEETKSRRVLVQKWIMARHVVPVSPLQVTSSVLVVSSSEKNLWFPRAVQLASEPVHYCLLLKRIQLTHTTWVAFLNVRTVVGTEYGDSIKNISLCH
jgi:hypothetical protein